jgi:hypothetical protein
MTAKSIVLVIQSTSVLHYANELLAKHWLRYKQTTKPARIAGFYLENNNAKITKFCAEKRT